MSFPPANRGELRMLGPYALAFDQADLPGLSQLDTIGNAAGDFPLVGAGTYDVVWTSGLDELGRVTFDYADGVDAIRTALETMFGAANVEVFASDVAAFSNDVASRLYILWRGELAAQPVALTVENDTGAETVAIYEQAAGDPTPRLGRVLFTPNVGDQILEIFWDFLVPFADVGNTELDVYFGDVTVFDPVSFYGLHQRKTIGSLNGGGYNNVGPGGGAAGPGSDDTLIAVPGAPFGIQADAAFTSSSADYFTPWGIRGRVREQRPFAVALGGSFSPVITAGELEMFVLVASPVIE